MGRRAYITQLALGRSAFEPLPETPVSSETIPGKDSSPGESSTQDGIPGPKTLVEAQSGPVERTSQASPFAEISSYQQQYDSRGHPEHPASRELSRQSRRAMNDVLATVGVCVGVNQAGHKVAVGDRSKPAVERATIDAISTENSIGLIIGSIDLALISLAGVATVGLKQRLQTFRFYSGLPLTQILKRERAHFGIMGLLFLGTPANLMWSLIDVAKEWIIDEFILDAGLRFCKYLKRPKKLDSFNSLIDIFKFFFNTAAFAVLAPLEMFSTLQRLGLLPGWPWLPSWEAFIPFSASSPLQLPILPTHFTIRSVAESLVSLAVSPLFLFWVIAMTRPIVGRKLRAYIRAAVPKPYRPDRYSLEAAVEDELDNDSIPGLCNAFDSNQADWESDSFLEELAKDLQYIGRNFQIFFDQLTGTLFRNGKVGSHDSSNPQHIAPQNNDSESPRTMAASSPSIISSSSSSSSTDTSSNSSSRPTTPHPPIEIITDTATTGTLRMNVQLPSFNQDALHHYNSFDSPSRRGETDIQNSSNSNNNLAQTPHSPTTHRITALTAYPADSLSHHLSTHLTDILFLPLESLFVRSLALNFLSSPRPTPAAQTAAARWRSEVYPLGTWFGMGLRGGGGGWKAVGDYAGKMVLVTGMEMGFSWGVWRVFTGFAWWSGRRWFGWGRL